MEENRKLNHRTVDFSTGLLGVTFAASVFSQIEAVGFFRPLMYLLWMAAAAWFLASNRFRLSASPFLRVYLVLYPAFVCLCLGCGLVTQTHLSNNYLKIMVIPLLVSAVAGLFRRHAGEEQLRLLMQLYAAAALVYAVWVNLTYFASYAQWLTQKVYVFEQKNSAAQIWMSAVFILLFLTDYRSKKRKAIGFAAAGYLLVLCALSQCRTAVAVFAVVLSVYLFRKSRYKLPLLAGLGGAALLVWKLPFTRSFLEQVMLLNKYQGAGLDKLSSGRITLWGEALEQFAASPLIGAGSYYVDCSYLSILAESGMLGFLLIEFIWFTRIRGNLRARVGERQRSFLFCITLFYIGESLLEGYPPFGPGVSALVFWFSSEFLCVPERGGADAGGSVP